MPYIYDIINIRDNIEKNTTGKNNQSSLLILPPSPSDQTTSDGEGSVLWLFAAVFGGISALGLAFFFLFMFKDSCNCKGRQRGDSSTPYTSNLATHRFNKPNRNNNNNNTNIVTNNNTNDNTNNDNDNSNNNNPTNQQNLSNNPNDTNHSIRSEEQLPPYQKFHNLDEMSIPQPTLPPPNPPSPSQPSQPSGDAPPPPPSPTPPPITSMESPSTDIETRNNENIGPHDNDHNNTTISYPPKSFTK
ncbi:hypothetical protein WICMUC_000810 [Wickerhamomyces mucosus]|uniref:Uncharacterized protein n=1 Tax=Wickerhamomyces mucosus TaxID=1378264 RepID=A0A9P8TIA5_9ASCO|nr:hypothetical protein WICMUC_000810 [Wickerhamomyces mucosus]